MRRLLSVTVVAALLAAATLTLGHAAACDLCLAPPPEFKTVQAELSGAETIVLAERSKSDAASRSGVVVRSVLRGGLDIAPGQRFDPASTPMGAGLFLLFGDAPRFDAIPARRVSEDVAAFMTLVARAPEKAEEDIASWGAWLALMTPYLSDRDPLIAGSAGLEFAEAPYAAVKAAAQAVDANLLLHALEDASTSARNRGALALLAGLAADEADVPRLRALVDDEQARRRPGYDAILAAYVTLRGSAGLAEIRASMNERLEKGDGRAVVPYLAALRFHAQNDAVVSRDAVLAAVRSLLSNDRAAPAAILELAALEDWESLDAVMETYRRLLPKGPAILGPVARYVHACPLPEAEAARAEVTNKKSDGE